MAKIRDATTLAKWSECLKDKELGLKILTDGKKKLVMNELDFLATMTHGDKKKLAYDKYIKNGAPKQVDVDGATLKKFDAIAQSDKPDWTKAPWDVVIHEILTAIRGKFAYLDH